MRISVDKRDKGHRFDLDLTRVRVYLDGQLFTRAVTADEEENLIIAHKYSEDGKPVVNEAGNAYVLETIKGKVKIEVLGDDGVSIRQPKVLVERVGTGLEVLVYSRIRPNNIRRHTLENKVAGGMSERQLAQACGMMAGAGAEHLCEQFGDIFDPSEAAAAGVAACELMLANEAQVTRH